MSALRFDGWVPFRLYWQAGGPGVEWCYLGSRPFSDPFFDATDATRGADAIQQPVSLPDAVWRRSPNGMPPVQD